MMEFFKKWGVIIATVPVLIGGWTTIVAVVTHVETIREIVRIAQEENGAGLDGLEQYQVLFAQHELMWDKFIGEDQ